MKYIKYGLIILGVLLVAGAVGMFLPKSMRLGSYVPTTGSTAILNIDSNRTDSYSQTGSYSSPYKTISQAIASTTGYGAYAYNLAPGTYVDGAPDTFPTSSFILSGNEATYIPVSGVTLPGSFDIYDLTIVGNVIESHGSISTIHQFNNGVITGNVSLSSLATFSGMVMPTATSTLTVQTSSLTNIVGSAIYGTINNSGILNLNDVQLASANSGYLLNSTSGVVYINGATIIQNGIGGAMNIQNGATSSPNSLSSFSIVVSSSSTSTVTAGTAATLLCDAGGFTTTMGVFIAPTGSNWVPCYDENLSVLNGFTVGTSTVTTNLAWIASPSSTLKIGVASRWPGCIEMYDAAASGTMNYIYSSGTTLVDTSTKPVFCL